MEPGQTSWAFFEGLFVRALQPTGAFLEELRAIGFDPAQPLGTYPSRVWADAIAVAARHVGGNADVQLAHRRVGYVFCEGFLDTILGGVIKVTLPFLTPRMVFDRWPRYVSGGRTDMTISVRREDKTFTLTCGDPTGIPGGFMAGVVDYALMLLQKRGRGGGTATVVERAPGDYDVVVVTT